MTDPLPRLVDEYIRKKFGKRKRSRVRAKRKKGKIVPAKGKTEWGRIYPDGREVCDKESFAGRLEYHTRTYDMAVRQGWVCGCGCGRGMVEMWGVPWSMTFDHTNLRGGGKRDDRIVDENGKPMNSAYRYDCNVTKGSKRLSKGE